jgi:hypothetical protein
MRVIGYIKHPQLKITVFKMEERFTLKFENELFEQAYKLRASEQIQSLEDIERLVDETFIQDVMQSMQNMNKNRLRGLSNMQTQSTDEGFETII